MVVELHVWSARPVGLTIFLLCLVLFIYDLFIKSCKKSTENMLRKSLMLLFLVMAICSFCGKDFVSLGRHSWRCKSKLHMGEESFGNSAQQTCLNTEATMANINTSTPSNCHHVTCCCGKVCKGLRGLKMHQRNCRAVRAGSMGGCGGCDTPPAIDPVHSVGKV